MDVGELLKGAFGLDAQTMIKKGLQNEDIYLSDDPAVLANEGLLGFLNDQEEVKRALERERGRKATRKFDAFIEGNPKYAKYLGNVEGLAPDQKMVKINQLYEEDPTTPANRQAKSQTEQLGIIKQNLANNLQIAERGLGLQQQGLLLDDAYRLSSDLNRAKDSEANRMLQLELAKLSGSRDRDLAQSRNDLAIKQAEMMNQMYDRRDLRDRQDMYMLLGLQGLEGLIRAFA